MRFAVDLSQGFNREMRIDLRGVQAAMAEQFLHHADVGASTQQVGGKTVAQGVRRGARRQAGGGEVARQSSADVDIADASSATATAFGFR